MIGYLEGRLKRLDATHAVVLVNGVGYQVMKAYQVFNMEGVIAWTLTFVVAMIVIEYGVINLAERRLTAWRPKIDVWRR